MLLPVTYGDESMKTLFGYNGENYIEWLIIPESGHILGWQGGKKHVGCIVDSDEIYFQLVDRSNPQEGVYGLVEYTIPRFLRNNIEGRVDFDIDETGKIVTWDEKFIEEFYDVVFSESGSADVYNHRDYAYKAYTWLNHDSTCILPNGDVVLLEDIFNLLYRNEELKMLE